MDVVKLCQYLKKQYGDDLVLEVCDDFSAEGFLCGKDISLFLDRENDILKISTKDYNRIFFNNLIPCLSIFMDGSFPIARYNIVDLDNCKNNSCVIEWNPNVDLRHDELRRSVSTSNGSVIIKNFKPLVETKQERDKRLGFSNFSPLYFPDGNLIDMDLFRSMTDNYNEQDCFLVLSLLENLQNQCWNKTWKGLVPDIVSLCTATDIVRKKALSFCGVESVYSIFDEIKYDKWYQSWYDYFTYEKKCEYMEARLKGEDVSSFQPKNTLRLRKGWTLI